MTPELRELVERIKSCAERYKAEYHCAPQDLVVGKDEFRLLYRGDVVTEEDQPSECERALTPYFLHGTGLRVWMLNGSGQVLVGNLSRDLTPSPK